MKGKALIILTLIHLVLFIGVTGIFAQEEERLGSLELSLADVINRAIEHSPTVKKAQLDLRLAEISYLEVEAVGLENLSPLQLQTAQQSLENAKEAVIEAMKTVALDIEDSYYQVLRSEAELEATKRSVESKERQYNIVEVQYKAGRESQKNLDQAKRAWEDAQEALENYLFSLETQMMEFCLDIGVPYGTTINLIDQFSFEPLTIDLAEAISFALENRDDLKARLQGVKEAEEKVALADNPWTPAVDLEKAMIGLDKARIDLAVTESSIEIIVRTAYASFLSAERNVLIREEALENAELELEKIKAQYEKGFATYNNVWDAEAAVEDATHQLLQAVFNYNKGKASFFQAIGKEYVQIDQLVEGAVLNE